MVDRARPSGLATNGSDASSRLVALEQVGQNAAGMRGLLAAEIVERNILRALQPAFRIPLGFAVANVIDRGHGLEIFRLFLAQELLSEISGASGRFMPTT